MSNCLDTIPVPSCFTPADPTVAPVSILTHVVYEQGQAIGQGFTSGEDTTTLLDPATYLGGGTVTPGACPVASPDVEWCKVCDDVNGDGTDIVTFYRRTITSIAADGTASVAVADFEFDKTTAYTSSGNELDCDGECEIVGVVNTIAAWSDLA